jgi:hypothetical protein
MTSAPASPAATTTAIATTVSTPIAVTATAKILAGTIVAGASGIVLGGIVMGCKILWRGSVGIWLAFLGRFSVLVLDGSGLNFAVMLLEMFTFGGARFLVGSMRLIRMVKFFGMKLFVVGFFVMFSGTRQGFARQQFDRRTDRGCGRGSRNLRHIVRVPVVVVLEIFENVADVQEGVAVQANVHESGLHAGEDAGDFSFVDAADEGEFFFALDVNFD